MKVNKQTTKQTNNRTYKHQQIKQTRNQYTVLNSTRKERKEKKQKLREGERNC